MKKLAVLFIVLNAFVASAMADTCRLVKPIPVGSANLMEKGLFLRGVRFDQTPRWTDPTSFDASRDQINLDLFRITYNDIKLNYLGASVAIEGKAESVGFSSMYSGNFSLQGSTNTSNGVTTYTTKHTERFTEPAHAKNDAITESTVVVQDGNLVSVALTFPVFKVLRVENGIHYVAFTGDHQTLCLKSAE